MYPDASGVLKEIALPDQIDPSLLPALSAFSQLVGDGTSLSFIVTHSFGTEDVDVAVWEVNSPFRKVLVDITIQDVNTVVVNFSTAPALNSYNVVVT